MSATRASDTNSLAPPTSSSAIPCSPPAAAPAATPTICGSGNDGTPFARPLLPGRPGPRARFDLSRSRANDPEGDAIDASLCVATPTMFPSLLHPAMSPSDRLCVGCLSNPARGAGRSVPPSVRRAFSCPTEPYIGEEATHRGKAPNRLRSRPRAVAATPAPSPDELRLFLRIRSAWSSERVARPALKASTRPTLAMATTLRVVRRGNALLKDHVSRQVRDTRWDCVPNPSRATR